MQNFKKLVVWKVTWGICKFSPEQLKVWKLGFWRDPLIQCRKSMSLKSTGNEEGCKMWRRIDLSFQNLQEEFDEFLTRAAGSLKKLHFNVLLLSKVCIFWAKTKYRAVIFHEIEEGYKIWRGIDLPFENRHKEFNKFWPEHSKVSKIFTLMGSFWAKYMLFELKKV